METDRKVVVGSVVYLKRGSFKSSETKKNIPMDPWSQLGVDLFKRGRIDVSTAGRKVVLLQPVA